MKIKKLLFTGLMVISLQSLAQNIQFDANLSYGINALANIGGYVDSLGNEYALVGTDFGLSIVDVTVPGTPVIKFTVNGPSSEWREVKTYRKYAYVTTEGGGGLQVIDLSNLPASINSHSWTGDGAIAGQLNSIHALHCDTAKGFLYLYGSNVGTGQTLFIDLADPWNPHYAGNYTFPGSGNDPYVHDGFVVNDTMYESHIYSGFCAIVDVTNKTNPVLLATLTTPTNFTHNTWLSDDHKTLFTTDENSGSYLGIFDIHDLTNITEVSRFQTAPGSGSIIHNTHILNDFAVTSWYTQGVVITDVARPHNPIEVGHYDTYPASDGNGFYGCWGVYPFLPSGTMVASDINNGLFVLTPTYVRGCYLEGIVTDSVTGLPLNSALVEILTTSITKNSDLSGLYATGTATAGTYDVRVSKPGYITRTLTGVVLTNGILTNLDVKLSPIQTFAFSGHVTDSVSSAGIVNATVFLSATSGLTYTATTDADGNLNFAGIVPDTYTMYAGKWGYRTVCSTVNLIPGDSVITELAQGYYDDFTFDFGWTVNGTSGNAWEKGEPVGTTDGSGIEINPEYDVNADCGDECYVTDNGGSPYNNHDVDNGNTILTSPAFDATIYQAPTISYYRRYLCINGTGQPNDTMKIYLTDGISTVLVESVSPTAAGNGTWVQRTFTLASLMTPTSNMQLIVEVSDNTPGNIVEGAFDQFEITGQLINSSVNPEFNGHLSAYPNPFNKSIAINYELSNYTESTHLLIRDIAGRIVSERSLRGQEGTISVGEELLPGMYLIELVNGPKHIQYKIVKQ